MSTPSLPVMVLTTLGAIIALIGFLVGGNVVWVIVGLGAVAMAGILQVANGRNR